MIGSDDTIIALATPDQASQRLILRLSGPHSWSLGTSCFRFSQAFPSQNQHIKSEKQEFYRGVYSGWLTTELGEFPAQLWAFPKDQSATGQPSVELHFPGSPILYEVLLRAFQDKGCRLAGPGEFTRRAYLAGKMDLSQAEAVMTLISSSDARGARRALATLEGKFSSHITSMLENLEAVAARIELTFDFEEEDLQGFNQSDLEEKIQEACKALTGLISGRELGQLLPQIVFVGPVNAGKSTLFNHLFGNERVVSANEAGTTRDAIRESIEVSGVKCEIVDTAGFKAATSKLEASALEQMKFLALKADIVLLLIDSQAEAAEEVENNLKSWLQEDACLAQRIMIIRTKVEVDKKLVELSSFFTSFPSHSISVFEERGILELKDKLSKFLNRDQAYDFPSVSARARELCQDALKALEQTLVCLQDEMSLPIAGDCIREALSRLRELLGKESSRDILDHIFNHFCIGK